jgi:sulfoxide reductase heme-binding subunit YedZ
MLHRAIYFAAVAGVIHYYWKVKSDVRLPLFYGALVAILLLWRLGDWYFKRRSAASVKLSAQRASANPSS